MSFNGLILAFFLLHGVSAIPPEDPDAHQFLTEVAKLCGSEKLPGLFLNTMDLRSALIYQGYNFVDSLFGSIDGIHDFIGGSCDVVFTMGALNATDFAAVTGPLGLQRTILQMPFAVSAIDVLHDMPGINDGELQLNADVLADIFSCKISSWADPGLAALNQGLRLPDAQIIPVVPAMERPETRVFTQYLASLSAAWSLGSSYNITSPACVVSGADATQQQGYRLGYSDSLKAPGGLWASASLQNRAGNFVSSYRNLSYLADMHMPNSVADWSSFTLATAEHPLAYPLAHLYFVILDADSSDRGYPAGKQIQGVAHALLSEPVQQEIHDGGYIIDRIHLNGSVVESFQADIANMVIQQTSPEDNRPSFCDVCGSAAYKQLLLDTTDKSSVSTYKVSYNFEGFSNAMYTFSLGYCNMMLLDDSLPLENFLTRQRAGQQIVQVPFAWRNIVAQFQATRKGEALQCVTADGLRLDADVLSAIFQCRITTWNHPSISALNENVTLPSARIKPMHDQSSRALVNTAAHFLSALSSDWSAASDGAVPPCVAVINNSSRLYETPFALGFSWLMQNKSSAAKTILIKNRAGSWVSGTTGNTSLPADVRLPSASEGELWPNFTFATSGADDVYPLTSASFMVWDLNATYAGYPAGEQIRILTSAFLSKKFQDALPQYSLDPLGIENTAVFLAYLKTISTTLVAKSTDIIPAGDPSKANMSIQAACSHASGISSVNLLVLAQAEVNSGRPFQVQSNLNTDQEAVDRLLGSNTNLDFVLSHTPASAQAIAASRRRIVHIPFGFSPLAVMYNIPGIANASLKLDAHALARLYTCKSLQLDDYIQGLNPTMRLPAVNVTPIALDKSDPASQMFIAYLAQDGAWDEEAGSLNDWATCVKVLPKSQEPAGGLFLLMMKYPVNIGYHNMDVYCMFQELFSMYSDSNTTDVAAAPATSDGGLPPVDAVVQFPTPSAASLLNGEGVFVSPVPLSNLSFPYNASSLPNVITGDWADAPASKDIPGAYPLGNLIYIIADQNIGSTGASRAYRLRSLMRTLVTQKYSGSSMDVLTGFREKAFVSLPPDMVHWANEQVSNLSIMPLSPKPMADILGAPTDAAGSRHRTLTLALSITLAGMVLIGLAVVGSRFFWRSGGSSVASSQMMLLADSDSGLGNSQESLELMADSQGKPVELGSGTYGKVYKGRWRGVLVAVKVLHRASSENQEDLLKEAAILRRLRHPNVVKFLGLGTNGSDQVMMITEFMQGGDLRKALDRSGPFMNMGWYKKGRSVAMGLAQSLAYLHSQSVISFDVKPENVLLDHTMTVARLTDVGLAKVLEGSHTNTMARGTFDYMAPELFGSYEHEGDVPPMSGEYRPEVTYTVDIYSFGCVLWEIVTGQRMQRSQTPLRDPRVPEECPQSIANLLKKCLSPDPKQRPSAVDVVSTLAYA
ncbi:probable serine/threonine-protein kinase DDB_G0281745 at C-terminar half [Coccomyxa sp. Obi]|nr:probable serine/threonine-protein kinase DDB_G0281745 at C-terminar half [Coccomyxa sp. Obi]